METKKFEELNISEPILRAVTEMGFEEATPIQSKAIPEAITGIDIIGQAQTGTGKTAAFGIPLLQKINSDDKHLQAIILSPTRELALQITEELRNLGKYLHGIKIIPVYGGQDITRQIRAIKAGTQIIVGTPGRVMDHMRRKTLKLEDVNTVVMDEADEMLSMGFREDMETILKETPSERQTVLFSATMPKPILDITKRFQKDAKHIKVIKKELTVQNIEQTYYLVKPKQKIEALSRLLDMYNPRLSLVFCNTKRQVDELVLALQAKGYFADGLHGDLKQAQRDRVMSGFRTGRTEILIATDVAARGIDVDDVDAVFNYDLPQDDEYYVHRIGRTGRAGREGRAFSFITPKDMGKLRTIERYCKTKINNMPIPSIKDVQKAKTEKILGQVTGLIEEEDLSPIKKQLERYMEQNQLDALTIAAAFLKQSFGKEVKEEKEVSFGNTGAEPGMVRFFINIGKNQKVRPGDILGAVAGESNIPGNAVGSIDMYDKYTFVEVPDEYAGKVLSSMKNVKIKGKSINVEPANMK